MNKPWLRSMGPLLAALAALYGCAGDSHAGSAQEEEASDVPEVETSELVASLALENGNTLDFYDLGSSALIAERGHVDSAPLYTPSGEGPERLVATWDRFARGRAAPPALFALQERLMHYDGPASFRGATATLEPSLPDVTADAPARGLEKSQCNNGCCNRDWLLQTFPLCRTAPHQFFIFDEPSPAKNGDDIMQMSGFVCAASSVVWDITVDGKLTRLRLSATQFTTVDIVKVKVSPWWDLSPFVDHDVRTVVRTVSPGTATYCGVMVRE